MPRPALPTRSLVLAGALLALAAVPRAQDEVEPFGPAGFTNPFFQHDFEFAQPDWEIVDVGGGEWMLHLVPNTDVITWTLPPGKLVRSVSALMIDFESEPFGDGGTSSFIARASDGNFAVFNTEDIGVFERAEFSVDSLGKFTGEPLGDIVSLQLQASNTGGGAGGIGAFWDDITVELVDSAFTDEGSGLAGADGVPQLTGLSTLEPGSLVKLQLESAAPGVPVALVLGASRIDAPFKGGVLVPAPDILLQGFTTLGDGTLTLTAEWPAGVPSGLELFVQLWLSDPAAPLGFAASNALAGTTP